MMQGMKRWRAGLAVIAIFLVPFGALAAQDNPAFSSLKTQVEAQLRAELPDQKFVVGSVWLTQMPARKNLVPEQLAGIFGDTPLVLSDFALEQKARRFTALVAGADGTSQVQVKGQYQILVDVPVAARQLSRGAIIQEEDIAWAGMPEKQMRDSMVLGEKAIIGMVAKHAIAEGGAFSMHDIVRARIIEKGGLVSMIYHSPYMELKATGYALEDGAEGEIIRVKNEKSGKVVQAKVLRNGEVAVNYEG